MAGIVRSRSPSGTFTTAPTNRRGQQHATQRFVEKGFDTGDQHRFESIGFRHPLAYEFFTLSLVVA
jgi:hypothetical protein